MKQKNKQKNLKQGFTLLELLVVVLIIGILAAIALPQYKMAVGKSKFATLKNLTKSIANAAQRYYLLHNTYAGISKLDIEIPEDSDCAIDSVNGYTKCFIYIYGDKIALYIKIDTGLPYLCFAFNEDENSLSNKICQKETGKKHNTGHDTGWNRYSY